MTFFSLTPHRISELGEIQARWQRFSCESEALSSWVCEREKELEDIDGNAAPLERQIHTVEVKKNNNFISRDFVFHEFCVDSHRLASFPR